MARSAPPGAITSLLVHDFGDGNGPGVFAAGLFTDSEDGPLHRIARWDGMRWHPLGAGMNNSVNALAVLQTQEQDVLVAGGTFNEAGGAPAQYIAQWDGSSWSGIGGGMNGPVFALATGEDGTSLIAGGSFTEAGGASAARVAQWDLAGC